ncbi:MAG: hypothetical protein C0503_03370 [Gemmatimonas sp.]|nr:hypothetical protein [Gemmatimonas sp.]
MAAIITLVAALLTVTSDLIGVFHDDAVYVLIAKALANGQGFVNPHLPGTPAAIHFPPMFPLLLAGVLKLAPAFPEGLAWIKFVNPLLLAAAAYGMTFGIITWLAVSPLAAALVVVASTVSLPMLVLTNVVISEPMFVAMFVPALFAAERLRQRGDLVTIVIASVLGAALILTRTIGASVVGATLVVLVLERRWRAMLGYGVLVVVLLLPWQLFVSRHAGLYPPELTGAYGSYLSWVGAGYREHGLTFVADVVEKNLGDMWWYAKVVLTSTLEATALGASAGVVAFALVLGGFAVALRRPHSRVLALAFALYMGVVIVWPFTVHRFVWTLWPLVVALAYVGWCAALRELRAIGRSRVAAAGVGLGVLLLVGYGNYNGRGLALGWASNASHEVSAYAEILVKYVNADTRLHGKRLAAEYAPMVALYTGQQVLPIDRLDVRDHLRPKAPRDYAAVMAAVDRRYAPDAYVMMAAGPHVLGYARTTFGPDRRFLELTPRGFRVRVFQSVTEP